VPPKTTTDPVAEPASQPVWDLPIRLFHWLLTALIVFSWWSVKYGDTEWHIWSGIGILTLLIFRLLWGFFGSSTARFANFVRGPRAIRDYLHDTASWRAIGHSPLGALSVVALFVAVAIQVGLGSISVDEDGLNEGPLAQLVPLHISEAARDIHEEFFKVVLALIALHVLAILYYRLAEHKKLTKPMITGRADLPPGVEPMRPAKWWVAVLCLIAAFAIVRWVVAGAPPFGP
jgi:cytochrome b